MSHRIRSEDFGILGPNHDLPSWNQIPNRFKKQFELKSILKSNSINRNWKIKIPSLFKITLFVCRDERMALRFSVFARLTFNLSNTFVGEKQINCHFRNVWEMDLCTINVWPLNRSKKKQQPVQSLNDAKMVVVVVVGVFRHRQRIPRIQIVVPTWLYSDSSFGLF